MGASAEKKQTPHKQRPLYHGGEGGIRSAASGTSCADVPTRSRRAAAEPLGDDMRVRIPRRILIKKKTAILADDCFFLAEKEGFEPSIPLWGIHDFQSCALDLATRLLHTGQTQYLIEFSFVTIPNQRRKVKHDFAPFSFSGGIAAILYMPRTAPACAPRSI